MPSPITGTTGNYFYTTQYAPKAIVILNRGTEFELDISNDVTAFSTQNGIDDILGSFTVNLANTSDQYINRFGYNKIKKMSAVEIFVNSSINDQPVKVVPGPKGDGENASSKAQLNGAIAVDAFSYDKSSFDSQAGAITTSLQLTFPGEVSGETINSLMSRMYKGFDDPKLNQFPIIKQFIRKRNAFVLQNQKSSLETKIKFQLDEIAKVLQVNKNNKDSILAGLNVRMDTVNDDQIQLGKITYALSNLNQDVALPAGIILEIPPVPVQLHRIFLGVLITISEETTPAGQMTLTLTGNSLGWWLKASLVNVHPALLEQGFVGKTNVLTPFENRLSQSNAIDIFTELMRYSTDDIIATSSYNINTAQDANRMFATQDLTSVIVNPDGTTSRNINKSDATPAVTVNKLNQALKNLFKGKYIQPNQKNPNDLQNIDITKQTYTDGSDGFQGWREQAIIHNNQAALNDAQNKRLAELTTEAVVEVDQTKKQYIGKQTADLEVQITASTKAVANADKTIQNNSAYKGQYDITKKLIAANNSKMGGLVYKGRQEVLRKFGIIDIWKRMFSQVFLELGNDGFLKKALPFKNNLKVPARLEGDYRSKADLAEEVARNLFFEFYFDTNGHFVLKPPFYNISISEDDAAYIVEDYHLVSLSTNDTVDGIITRVTTTGDYQEAPFRLPEELTFGTYQDLSLIRDYGVHAQQLQSVIFIRSLQDSIDFGQAYMTRANQSLKNASITITGRPEIRLGTSLYLKPRDTVYYIKDISHQFNVKGQYTTTVTCIGARRIVYGYKVTSGLNEFFTNYDDKLATNLSYLQKNENEIKIVNYIPVSASNYADDVSGQPLRARDGSILEEGKDSNGKVIQRQMNQVIMANTYIITSHPSIGLVGLIVDGNNPILKATNLAAFNTLKDYFNPKNGNVDPNTGERTGIPRFAASTYTNIQKKLNPDQFTKCISTLNFLLKSFVTGQYYVDNHGNNVTLLSAEEYENWHGVGLESLQTSTGAKEAAVRISDGFTNDAFESFSNFAFDFLSAASSKSTTIEKLALLGLDYGVVLSNEGIDFSKSLLSAQDNAWVLRQTVDLLGVVLPDIAANGGYRQYTDDHGRELPAKLDYGLSLQLQTSATETAKNFGFSQKQKASSNANSAIQKNKTVSDNKTKGMKLAGIANTADKREDKQGPPNIVQKALDLKSKAENLTAAAESGKNPLANFLGNLF
jgi:hypothetical protein